MINVKNEGGLQGHSEILFGFACEPISLPEHLSEMAKSPPFSKMAFLVSSILVTPSRK